ncbi:MAG: undecaprenyl/decaprenyl-phosphate alpha-N-acetylglucosaminyl 1-phosphate transferase, partial [Gallionella sp.]|nr:undecaprenyl/decaprenyl-phosphate alpha-N-acetylglucosaminyl 1-phosphate transferase [Gallionella sp.]
MSIFFVSFFVCVVLIFLLRKLARGWGMLDHPDERKQHTHPTPTVGGIAMFVAVLIAVKFGLALTYPQQILLACSAALVALGVFDDKHNLAVNLRLMIQVTLALIVILGAQGTVSHIGTIFGIPLNLGLLAVPLSLIAFVGGINAMNMIDGADGMAGGMALITMIGVVILCSMGALDIPLNLPVALLGALAGFLTFNSRVFMSRAKIFMGDAGSMWLGLVLGWFMAKICQQASDPSVIFWLFGLPLIDTLAVMFRRMRSKKSPFKADRTHLHHVLEMR